MSGLGPYLIAYLVVGVITAITTRFVFPPVDDYRPALAVRVTGAVVLTLMWPFMAFITVWYLWFKFSDSASNSTDSQETDVGSLREEPTQGDSVSKPR